MDIRTNDMIIGTSAYADADTALLKEAGIGWVRQNFPFPFEDKTGGDISEAYEKAKASAAMWRDKGFRVMGVTPLYGIGKQEPDDAGHMCMVWHEHYPAYMDLLGSTTFVQNYRELCRFLAQDLHGLVEMWQISNELDITLFAGPLNLRQASDLILESARGLKMGDPGLIVGTNTGGSEKAYYLYGYLHADPDGPLDYCGVDQYYGTWQPGGPERWDARIAELYAICGGVKVLVNEWGYSSAGGLLTEEERETQPYVCQHKKWYHAWDAGHTPDLSLIHI